MKNSWCKKVKSFITCKQPKFEADGTTSWTNSKTLILDVIKYPGKNKIAGNTQVQNDSEVDHVEDCTVEDLDSAAFINRQISNFQRINSKNYAARLSISKQLKSSPYDVNRILSWFGERDNEEMPDDLISLDSRSAKTKRGEGGWSKKELVESQERKEFRQDKQTSLLGSVILLMCAQLFSACILIYELFNFDMKPVSASIVLTRFTCGLVFHIYVQSEFKQGFKNMKFALNHPWKFERPILAFFVGFCQTFTVFVIELINYILVVGSNTHMEIILGFFALVLIVHFSNFFFQPMANSELRKLVSGFSERYNNFLRIQLKTAPRIKIFKT